MNCTYLLATSRTYKINGITNLLTNGRHVSYMTIRMGAVIEINQFTPNQRLHKSAMKCSTETQSRVLPHFPMLPAKSTSKLPLEGYTLSPYFSTSEKSVCIPDTDGEQVFPNCGRGNATKVVRSKPD